MTLTVRDATLADADLIVKLRAAAFDNVVSRWLDMTGPADRIPGRIAQRETTILGQYHGRVCCDASGRIVGYGKYKIVDHLQRPDPATGPTALARLEAALLTLQWRVANAPALWTHRTRLARQAKKVAIFGRALETTLAANRTLGRQLDRYVYLETLVVLPQAQGTGVGARLLQEVMDLARARRLPTYLESSVAGYPFYLKKGFEDFGQTCPIKDDDGTLIETLRPLLWQP